MCNSLASSEKEVAFLGSDVILKPGLVLFYDGEREQIFIYRAEADRCYGLHPVEGIPGILWIRLKSPPSRVANKLKKSLLRQPVAAAVFSCAHF